MEKQPENKKHPRALEPFTLLLTIGLSVIGAIIGMQLIVTLGISANTAIIGALIAMVISRIPVTLFRKYRSVHRQNLIQTAISSATFGAGNSLMIPIGIPFMMGHHELIIPMLIGAVLAMFVDAAILYRLFDSKVFPASGAWPPGIATAESIKAGDQGGKRAGWLGLGALGGIAGSAMGIPMSAFGVAFIGNIWALLMFGVGLLLRGYSVPLFGVDVNKLYIPHGFMIGAGVVALIQVTTIILKKKKTDAASAMEKEEPYTRTEKDTSRALGFGFIAYLVIALIIAIIGGVITKMSFGMLLLFLLFAAFAAFVHEVIVGIAAMHSGWFPAFAVALITLIIGILIGFPPLALGLLVGFSAATGPAFADMGYDLKTGYILRGNGEDMAYELDGRKQQFIAGMIAFGVAAIAVLIAYKGYFAQNLVPPVDKVYAATIEAGVSGDIARQLFLWAIPGAILQIVGGSKRQMGVLFATGLLLLNVPAGWAVLAGIVIRAVVLKVRGKQAETTMSILAAGFIAGDALYSFFSSVFKLKKL
ncbi:OPT family oligopeptide transporter [Brevibacillus borstelensis]|uniref:OPT/YSL family transporter n=1 Tax=Brevibacillus borstelensis TaxID=45462 RepID=UPI000F08B78D|nr:OPT/YSL family transporter [Brevibacillus borstelensis]MED1881419.1 OPT/YSL family transporter [Brevibacillus borstelensis]RNB66666.1 OPT family oligopeptide transporter [Brevibacillus borstelensis]GED52436.1 membrane protein [Brevibacillus borstelensis]